MLLEKVDPMRSLYILTAILLASSPLAAATQQATQAPATPSTSTSVHPTEAVIKADLAYCGSVLNNPEADINSNTPSGMPVLVFLTTLYLNHIPVAPTILYALTRQADPNILGHNGKTPLYYLTAFYLCPELFEKKTDKKEVTKADEAQTPQEAPVAQETTTTQTPEAAQEETYVNDADTTLQLIELFLFFGGNPLLEDGDKTSPVHLAASKQNIALLSLFQKYGWITILQENDTQELMIEIQQEEPFEIEMEDLDKVTTDQTVTPQA